MPDSTTIDVIRHGEPVGGRRYRGQIDDPLSELGWSQMWKAVAGPAPWSHIVTSPLARCGEFADALGERLNLSVSRDPRLKEIGFGAWEGLTGEQLRARDPDCIRRFYADPATERPQGAEPLEDFVERVAQALNELFADYRHQHILVVAHAGVIRAMIASVLNLGPGYMYRIQVGNAALTRFRDDGERPAAMLHHGLPSIAALEGAG